MDARAEVEVKRAGKNYKIKVKIDPMPNNCYECPFFHLIDTMSVYYDEWKCSLHLNEGCWGNTRERYKDCPLEVED